MTYLAILLLMLVAFTLVGWPLLASSRGARRESGADSSWDELIGQRDTAYRGIKELDFEYQLGNLSESDYRRLRQRYRSEAAAALRRLDAAASGESEAPLSEPAASIGVTSTVSPQAGPLCPSCGRSTETADRYCWSCGAQLSHRCTSCGSPVEAGHQFCPGCGSPLEAAP